MRNEELSKELERKRELETAFVEIQKRNRELEKKRNLRRGMKKHLDGAPQVRKKCSGRIPQRKISPERGADSPEEPGVQCFCLKLSALLKKAIGMFGSGDSLNSYRKRALKIKEQIMEIYRRPAQHPSVQYLQNIFRKKEDCLFQWIRSPDIPCENNYAERGLRPLAVSGKISYGSQSERGMKTREILASVLHTAAARALEPAAFLEAFLNDSRNASLLFS